MPPAHLTADCKLSKQDADDRLERKVTIYKASPISKAVMKIVS